MERPAPPLGGGDDTGLKDRMAGLITRSLRRARARMRIFRRQRRFSPLTLRIILLNLIALVLLIGGVLYVNVSRISLIEERILSLKTQGAIMAAALAEGATEGPEATTINKESAIPLLRRLAGPTATRSRVFDSRGLLMLDTRQLLPSAGVESFQLPPPDGGWLSLDIFNRIYDFLADFVPGGRYPPYIELDGRDGTGYEEVRRALGAEEASAVRINSSGELVISVAVPVQRFQLVLGVLMLSTEGDDISRIVRSERLAIFQVALVALFAMIFASIALSRFIARPVKALAEAADKVRHLATDRVEIPDFTHRRDEIGELSTSLRDMTQALYDRIDAIEQFAADVAHEIKNPLTSLRSAVETMRIARDDATRARLMEVIEADVSRVNRLVSDISDASRLDAELSRTRAAPVDLALLAETIAGLFNNRGGKVAVRTQIDSSPQELTVPGLAGSLGQVLSNLVENAVSFSPEGAEVVVHVRRTDGHALMIVEDHGPGIPPENLETIFRRFYTSRPEEHGFGRNSGLGLSISRQIVEVHGGTIRAENRRNAETGAIEGARFIVTLPA